MLLTVCAVLFPMAAHSGRDVVADGEFTVHVEDSETVLHARDRALKGAMNGIIADKFGTVVGKASFSNVSGGDGTGKAEYRSYSQFEVKGEWLETLEEPVFTDSYSGSDHFITVRVKGRIREIKSAPVSFQAKLLRQGTADWNESEDFHDGDSIYLSFVTPTRGFLAVYLDDNSGEVFRLLPYPKQEELPQLSADKRYVFFSRDRNVAPREIDRSLVNEYHLTCSSSKEVNELYIIFSPNSFSLHRHYGKSNYSLPRLSFDDFQKWLTKNRRIDTGMCVETKYIIISK